MSKSTKLKIVMIEDHEDIRFGVSFILNSSPEFECLAFKSAEMALETFSHQIPDVVLMDIQLPGMDGIECTKIIRKEYPNVQILMCTVYEDSDKIFNALKAGAHGYILKRSAGTKLIEAIKELVNGGSPMSTEIARKVVSSFNTIVQETKYEHIKLSKRENEILDLLAKGFRNKEIADKLFVSPNTIRCHIYNIYEKLHVQSRIEAINKTGRNKL